MSNHNLILISYGDTHIQVGQKGLALLRKCVPEQQKGDTQATLGNNK
jgi:hypothetical protein